MLKTLFTMALAMCCGGASFAEPLIPAETRSSAPDFALQDAQGRLVRLHDYRGSVVLLDFWATWCGGCKMELPWYVSFDKQYRMHGLRTIGASMDEDGWKAVKPFLPQHGIEYPVVLADKALVSNYHVQGLPVTVLIDRQGRIALAHEGVVNRAEWEQAIRTLLDFSK